MTQDYFHEHLSLSQWAIETELPSRELLLDEEASKGERLEILNKTIGLPIVETTCLKYEDILGHSKPFLSQLARAGENLYAVTAYPKRAGHQLLRNRKKTLPNLIQWILSMDLEFDQYDYCFEPHVEAEISLILAVNERRIIGEACIGGMLQLSKGKPDGPNPIYFEYDFCRWTYSEKVKLIEEFLERTLACLSVLNSSVRTNISKQLNESFTNGYLRGYFEAIWNEKSGLVFIEHNRFLKNKLDMEMFPFGRESNESDVLIGRGASSGKVEGKARVVDENQAKPLEFRPGEIVVCRFISARYSKWIRSAAAIVADTGGILSHPAIICRELGKPCVVATKHGTDSIRTGDSLEVDARNGVVRILN